MRFVEVDVFGLPEFDLRLAGIAERAEHARPVFEKIAENFADHERELFATDGDGRWDPLSKPYAAWKARHYPGRPVNVLTGTLRDSLTTPGAKYGVRRVGEQELVVGTKDPVAQLSRHFGRNPVPLSRAEEAVWVEEIQRWVVRGEL